MKEANPSKKAINTIEGRLMSKKKQRKIAKLQKYTKIEEMNKVENKANGAVVGGERMDLG
jgi:hypothetical protein